MSEKPGSTARKIRIADTVAEEDRAAEKNAGLRAFARSRAPVAAAEEADADDQAAVSEKPGSTARKIRIADYCGGGGSGR